MPFGESQIPGLRLCMAMFAAVALLLGAVMSFEGHMSLALTNFCGGLFFVFAYHNPDFLIADNALQAHLKAEDVAQKKFLWTSLAVGMLAIVLEFKEHLPLG